MFNFMYTSLLVRVDIILSQQRLQKKEVRGREQKKFIDNLIHQNTQHQKVLEKITSMKLFIKFMTKKLKISKYPFHNITIKIVNGGKRKIDGQQK